MMFGYELQRRVRAAGKGVQVHVCHPGASRTDLLKDEAGLLDRIPWGIMAPIVAQSAERGSWPEVMCATEDGLEPERLYGPTKRADTVGPVGECSLDDCALDRDAATRLWAISEQRTSLRWSP